MRDGRGKGPLHSANELPAMGSRGVPARKRVERGMARHAAVVVVGRTRKVAKATVHPAQSLSSLMSICGRRISDRQPILVEQRRTI